MERLKKIHIVLEKLNNMLSFEKHIIYNSFWKVKTEM